MEGTRFVDKQVCAHVLGSAWEQAPAPGRRFECSGRPGAGCFHRPGLFAEKYG